MVFRFILPFHTVWSEQALYMMYGFLLARMAHVIPLGTLALDSNGLPPAPPILLSPRGSRGLRGLLHVSGMRRTVCHVDTDSGEAVSIKLGNIRLHSNGEMEV